MNEDTLEETMKHILVTGAGGYIGRHVVDYLVKQEIYKVYAADINLKDINEKAIRIEKDIFDGTADLYNQINGIDLCIHLAWSDGFAHNSFNHILNIERHCTFLKNLIDQGLKNLTVMGSMHEIGYWNGEITEDTPCNPLSFYGVAKNTLRQFLSVYCQGRDISLKWLRGFYICGDDWNNHSIFTKLLTAEKNGEQYFPFTSGKNMYDFITIDTLTEQIVKAAVQDEVSGIINVCSGKPVALGEKVEEFIKKNNLKIKLNYGAFPDRKYDSPAVWGNNSKIMEILRNECKD